MALPDLTGQNIENTYQRVLQTDGTIIYDGTGSVFLPVSASYSVTASYAEYAVSASHEIIKEVSSSYADYSKESGLSTSSISASYAITASYALNSPDIFPYTGSAVISGSLDVIGDITGSGKIDLNDGSNNVLISTDNNTITTSNTVAVGYQALTNLTTGIGNTALGYQAGISLTTSNRNTVIGFEAGSSHSSHSTSVTAIGYQAGKSTTLGGIFIGSQAGINVNNSSNILIGNGAGSSITSGNGNTGIGDGSLRSATLQNVGIGHETGRYGAGSYSVLIGYQAGRGSSGNPVNQTTLLGYKANYLGNGNNDVMVGRNAGLLLTSSNGNILIGDNVASTETSLNNKLYIENSNSTTPLIYGEFDNDLVRINGKLFVSNSLDITGSVSASTYYGDGSNLTGIETDPFPYTGSAVISGSLEVIGETSITGSTYIKGAIWAQGTNSIIYLGSQYNALQIKTGGIYLGGTANNGGNNGVSIGNNAGRFASGNNNALVGNQAGYRAAYSNGYVAIGKNSNSGDSAYNKDNSVGVGIGSNYNGSTNTVAIGGYSGNYSSNTPYTSSVFIGTSAGIKGGSNSVYVGHQSRGDGTGNTALGYQTGLYSSGSNNLFLGYQAGYNLTGSNQLIIANNSSSALVTGDFENNTFNISGSVSASTYYGDGSNLTGIETDPFPYTGSAIISGSLTVTGSISSTDTVTAVTGSFSHLKGNSPITIQDPVTFQHTQGLDVLGNATIHSINEVELQTISKDFNYTSSLNITEITSSVNGMVIDYRLTNLNSGSRVGTFMYAHDGTELSYNDLTIPGGGIGNQPILSASLVNDLVKIDIENAAGFNFTGYAKKFNKLANAIPVADPNITYILNEFPGENALAAYSIRQLNQFYTGSAMRVRRLSDNSELDIEYDVNGELDTLAIEAHCGNSQGRVTIWYDQSGNTNNISESNASLQPIIWTGTGFYTLGSNNKPSLRPRGAFPLTTQNITPDGLSIVAEAGNSYDVLLAGSNYSDKIRTNAGQTNFLFEGAGATLNIPIGGYRFYSALSINRNTQWEGSANNNPIVTGSATGDFTVQCLFARVPGGASSLNDGYGQEFIFWENEQSTNTLQIKSNQNNYYGVYDTGLLAEYPDAAAAYSVRLLHSVYTGPSLRIREDGTNTETDIGFDSNGDLDTASIASHCGANNGLVVTWYDQSGNGNDATQSTVGNQPKIYDGTTGIVLENGKPAIDNQGGTNELLFTSISSVTNIAGVAKANVGGFQYIVGQGGDGALRTLNGNWSSSANSQDFPFNGALFINSSQMGTISAQSQRLIFANAESGGTSLNLSVIGGTYPSRHWDGPIQEVILWTTNQSSNRTGIESNINTYFNIYP